MFVSRTTAGWEALTPAKLNLYLDVLGRRMDGFHELEMLMCPVRLFDQLCWVPADSAQTSSSRRFHFCTTGAAVQSGAEVPSDDANLAVKAAQLLGAEAGIEPYGKLSLTKEIPTQAGMGGGSSDAAATLQLLNRAWGVNFPKQRLSELAGQLGSDVPFFFAGGTAICRGRGEILEPQQGLPKLHFVVVKPPECVSTGAAFAQLNAPEYDAQSGGETGNTLQRLLELLRSGMLAAASKAMSNSFQEVITAQQPALASLYARMAKLSPWGAMMTGSGSAFFSLCRTARCARHLASRLRAVGNEEGRVRTHGTVWTTSTCY